MRTGAKGFTNAVNESSGAVNRLNQQGALLGTSFSTLRNLGATLGIGVAVKEAADYGDKLFTSQALTAAIVGNTQALGRAQQQALTLSNQLGVSYGAAFQGLEKMLTVMDGNVEGAGNLVKLAGALRAINPAEGFEGAMFALKELEGGDTMSLRERFNIKVPTQEEAKKIAAKDGRSVKQVMIGALQDYIDRTYGQGESGAGVEYLLQVRAQTIGGQVAKMANQFRNLFTPMLLPFLEKTSGWLQQGNAWLSENANTIRGVGAAFLEVLPRAAALFSIYQGFYLLSNLWGVATAGVSLFKGGLIRASGWLGTTAAGVWNVIRSVAVWGYQSILSAGMAVRGVAQYIVSLWATRPPMASMLTMISVAWTRSMAWLASASAGVLRYGATLFTTAIPAMWAYVSTLNFAAIGQTLLNTLMLANPVGLIIAGVVALGAVFYGLFKLVDKLFPGFFSGVKEWFGKAWNFIYEVFIAPVVKFFKWLGDLTGISAAFSAGSPVSPEQASGLPTDAQNQSLFALLGLNSNGLGMATKGKGGLGDIGVSQKMDSVSGSREAIKNINIRIDKQVETLVFQTIKDLGEVESKLRSVIERALADATNQANYAN